MFVCQALCHVMAHSNAVVLHLCICVVHGATGRRSKAVGFRSSAKCTGINCYSEKNSGSKTTNRAATHWHVKREEGLPT